MSVVDDDPAVRDVEHGGVVTGPDDERGGLGPNRRDDRGDEPVLPDVPQQAVTARFWAAHGRHGSVTRSG